MSVIISFGFQEEEKDANKKDDMMMMMTDHDLFFLSVATKVHKSAILLNYSVISNKRLCKFIHFVCVVRLTN